MTLSEFESLANEVRQLKIDLLQIKNRVIAAENSEIRLRLKKNAAQRRENFMQIESLRREAQPTLPF